MGFEEIKKYIKENVRYGLSWIEDGEEQVEIILRSITLTGVMVPIKDDLDHHYILPAWVVSYQLSESSVIEAFAVNAIDGSSIDLTRRVQ